MLRVLSSTGTMITVFQHQRGQILNWFLAVEQALLRIGELLDDQKLAIVQEPLAELQRRIKDIESQYDLFGLMFGRNSRDHRQTYALRQIVERLSAAFASYMEIRGIVLRNEVQPSLRTPPMYLCEIVAILLNFMTNALKAIREGGPSGGIAAADNTPERAIRITGSQDAQWVTVIFCNTGKVAPREKWDEYFEPFVGDSQSDPLLGHGTGLGLSIVKWFADTYDGIVGFVDPDPGWATCIRIKLPKG